MKTFLKHQLTIVLLLIASAFMAAPAHSAISTTLYSENFQNGFPSNWYDNYLSSYGYTYWYASANGYNGSNGSIMFDEYNYGYGDIYTPNINTSGFTGATDKVYVEFDYWFEKDYWVIYGDDYMDFTAYDGFGNSTLLKGFTTSNDFTIDNSSSYGYYADPLTSPGYWKHIKILVPASYRTPNTSFSFLGYASGGGGNFGIDNFTVTGQIPLNITYNPTVFNFGTVSSGVTSPSQCVTINNPNNYPVSLSSTTLGGTNPTQFNIIGTPPTVIAARSSVSICVAFSPTQNGVFNAKLNIATNSDNFPFITIDLNGTGVAPIIQISPVGSVNTATKMFKKTRTSVRGSLDQSFVVSNVGAGTLVVGAGTFFSGAYLGDYSVTRFPAAPIANGNSDTMTIRFSPTAEGGRPATINILSNASNGPQLIDLYGVGVISRIQMTPGEVMTFDSIPIGVKICKDVVISNPGSDSLRITKNYFSSNDGDFSFTKLVGDSMMTIAPLDSRTISICITPLQKGTRRARLRITTTIPATFDKPSRDTSVAVLEIWANAVPSDLSSIAMKDFSDVILGEEATATATVTNSGSEPITLDQPVFSSANAKEFKVAANLFPMKIAPGKIASFDVIAVPTVRGTRTTTIDIAVTSDDGNTSVLTAPLTVKALLACSEASASNVIFEKLFLGENATKTVKVSNCGDIAQTFTATLTATADLSIQGAATSGIIAPGEKAVFSVHFDPLAAGEFTGTLAITGDHIAEMSIPVSGTSEKKAVAQGVSEFVEVNGYTLSQNYPNPAGGKTHFTFTTPNDGTVHIVLADVTGKVVKELANGNYTAGTHTIEFKTNDLGSGTYIYLLETGGTRLIRQMVISK